MNTAVPVGTDGTPRAQIAVGRAAALAASTQARLIVLSVVETQAIATPIGSRASTLSRRPIERRHDADQAVVAGDPDSD